MDVPNFPDTFTDRNAPNDYAVNIATKRVSFDEHQVKTFVYEKDTHVGDVENSYLPKQFYTNPNAPPSRVTVIAERSEMPTTIHPPTQIEETRNETVSPPLPALIKKMESETENPFRPQKPLFHEVDPIVEAYKTKPYPPSLPGSLNTTPVKNNTQAYVNGISSSSLAKDKEIEKPVTESTPLTDVMTSNNDVVMSDSELPKASQVECVRIEKKKCGCCSLQKSYEKPYTKLK